MGLALSANACYDPREILLYVWCSQLVPPTCEQSRLRSCRALQSMYEFKPQLLEPELSMIEFVSQHPGSIKRIEVRFYRRPMNRIHSILYLVYNV